MPAIVRPISELIHSRNACGSEITQWGIYKEKEKIQWIYCLCCKNVNTR